jgi:hypothetical protein
MVSSWSSLPALVDPVRASPRWIYAGEKVLAYRASRPPHLRQAKTFAVPTTLAQDHTTVVTVESQDPFLLHFH